MPGDEPRRSGRANKGQHKHTESPAPEENAPPVKPAKKGRKAAQEETEDEDGDGETIRCICGNQNPDDKRAFIGCDACSVWQHNVCMGMPDDEDEVGEHYFCEQCKPDEHGETLEALAREDKIWETRNKLWAAAKKSKSRKSKGGDDKPAWLKRELRGEEPEPTPEPGNKRKRSIKEEEPETEQAPIKAGRQDKRRKAEAKAESAMDPETQLVPIEMLPNDRQKIVQALVKVIAENARDVKLKTGDSLQKMAEHHASRIEYAMHINHNGAGTPAYATQFRALHANMKRNRLLVEELLAGHLTADELSTMSSSDMASEELQKERALMKAEADRQVTIEQVDSGPRYRRTHKGDEIVESEAAATSSAPVARPVRQSTEDNAATAASPTAISPGGAQDTENRRTLNSNFDMQNIWAKTGQTTKAVPMPARQRSSITAPQADGTKVDADVDRLLADDDDDEAYEPQEFPGNIVWRGKVVSTTGDQAPMVNARWVAGRDISQTMPWRSLLPDRLNIDGRLQVAKAEEYLCGLQWSSSSDVSVLSLTPYDDAQTFNGLFEYFKSRGRYAVVNKYKPSALLVKDLYIIPVDVGDKLPEHIEMLEHCTLRKPIEERLLLATFVVARSAEPIAIATNGHHDRINAQGPVASPINVSGFANSPHPSNPSQVSALPAAASPSQEDVTKMAQEMLGTLFYTPVAQQLLAAPGVTADIIGNMKRIFEEDPAAQRDMQVLISKLYN